MTWRDLPPNYLADAYVRQGEQQIADMDYDDEGYPSLADLQYRARKEQQRHECERHRRDAA